MNDPASHPEPRPAHPGSNQPGSNLPETSRPGVSPRQVLRITPELWVPAAERLVGQRVALGGDPARARLAAAKRFVDQAPAHGIDMSLAWATLDSTGSRVRQVCLGVLGSGRTAMLFLSGPGADDQAGPESEQHSERVAVIRACTEKLHELKPGSVALFQALPEPQDTASVAALRAAEYTWVGNLSYLRRPLQRSDAKHGPTGELPPGVAIVTCDQLGTEMDAVVTVALERSYLDTRDCPALCGLRDTADVLTSHRETGVWDPSIWWILTYEGQPEGCMLLAQTPEHDALELVYIGLGPKLRGLGLGSRMLRTALMTTAQRRVGELTCAVDRANDPAMKLYRKHSFVPFASRVAFVQPTSAARRVD